MSFDSIESLAVLAGILFIAGIVKGVSGIGLALVGVPLLGQVVSIKQAVALVAIPMVMTNFAQAVEGGETMAGVRRMLPLIVAFFPGVLIGLEALFRAEKDTSHIVAGATLILAAILTALTKPGVKFWARKHTSTAGAAAGFIGGVLSGASGVGGPPMLIYLLGFGLTPKEFTKLASIFIVSTNVIMAAALLQTSRMTWTEAGASSIATIPVFAGMYFGQLARDRITGAMFRWMILAMVLASGVDLVARGATGR